MPVNAQHSEYGRMHKRWKRCRDVADGQDAVHDAKDDYLPRLADQEPAEYDAYRGRATFYNATWRTIAGLKGMLFRHPPRCDVPEQVKEMLDDATLSGVSMHELAEEVCEEALKVGRLGLLVDYPQANVEAMTLADAKMQNLRPMMNIYRAESVINWKTGRVRNVTVLTMVVLKECEMVQVDEFTAKAEDRFRVLDLVEGGPAGHAYRVRMFKMGEDGKDVLLSEHFPLMNGKPLDYIPFTFVGPDDSTPEVDEPPLIDLVNLNLSHYRSTADLEHGAHFTALPTPVVTGYTPEKEGEKLKIGSMTAWIFRSADADAKYLEFTGQGLEALRGLLKDKEQQMAVLGARMLEPQKKGVETADSQSIHRKGEESMLAGAAQSISLALTKALRWFAAWAGSQDAEVEYELNRDFYPAAMTPEKLTALVSAWQQGAISDEVLFEQLQVGEVIGQETTFEEEQQRLLDSKPKINSGLDAPPLGEDEDKDKGQQPPKKRKVTAPGGKVYTIEDSDD